MFLTTESVCELVVVVAAAAAVGLVWFVRAKLAVRLFASSYSSRVSAEMKQIYPCVCALGFLFSVLPSAKKERESAPSVYVALCVATEGRADRQRSKSAASS